MGCFGSREDSRRKAFDDDWTGTDYAFAPGSVANLQAFCPLDKIVLNWLKDKKELKDAFELPLSEEKAKELATEAWAAMKEFTKSLEGGKESDKEGEVFGKYSGKDAYTQMDAVMTCFAEKSACGLTWPEAAAAEVPEGMDAKMGEGDMAGGDAEMAEGGEEKEGEGEAKEGEAAGMDAMMAKMSLVALDAFGEIGGAAEMPKCLLALMFSYPVFGDAVKAATMAHDLGGDKSANFGSIAAVVGAYVNAQEKAEADSFGAAWLTSDDMDELNEVLAQKEAKALVFPGIVGGWADEKDALGQAPKADGKTQVLFKFKGKTFKPAGDKLIVFCRQFAKVESLDAPKDDIKYYTCTLSDFTDHVYESVEAWKDAVGKVGAVVADAKDAGMEKEEKKDEGEMMMAEGAGMDADAA